MTELLRLCLAAAVTEGEPQAVTVPGLPPLVVYEVDGAYFIADDTCTHGKARLSDGFHDGYVIACPLHGGSFDIRSGAPKSPPCE
ncbi:non-heme iron oxygenase ferredoxin subunit, partial [Leclercia adecarboxylata]|uniref:non-heme iron oxygenase ferredoxin subunit n=1 Tax=Leclercia adecarboxylata TaxID=83655 RepID=UPI00234E2178